MMPNGRIGNDSGGMGVSAFSRRKQGTARKGGSLSVCLKNVWISGAGIVQYGNGCGVGILWHLLAYLGRRGGMIEVTKLNDIKILINPDLIEYVEETPDTVVALTTGRKIIVKESRQEVKNLVKSYRKEIFAE